MQEKNPITLLKIKEIMQRFGWCKQTIYNRIKKGLFIQPVHTGVNSSRWPSNEVDRIQAAYIAGKDDEYIRTLVKQLMLERQQRIDN